MELEFGIFAILGALLALYGFKYKIVFLEDKIIKYSMLRKNQIFISSITQIEMVQDNLRIYSNDIKVININILCMGFGMAIQRLKEKGISLN